jgi:hypothetical protein
MTNEITYGVAVLAVIAIAMSAYGLVTPETIDTSDFVLVSEQKEFVTTVNSLLDGMQEPCYQDSTCTKFFARKFITEEQLNPVINDLVAVDEQLKSEIIVNRDNFKDNHPFNFEPDPILEPPVEGEQISPLVGLGHKITVTLEKADWLKGELVVISGEARVAQGQVEITITQPPTNEDPFGKVRHLNAIVTDKGQYQIFFGTDFKLSPLGEYTVFVQQRNSTSETISFNLVE